MNNSNKFLNFLSYLLIFLSILYMLKTLMGVDLVKNCHLEEILFINCNSPEPTIIDKMYETYQF